MILKIGFASAMTNLTSTLCTVLEVLHEGGPAPSNLYGSRIFLRKCGPTSLDTQMEDKRTISIANMIKSMSTIRMTFEWH